MSFLNNFGGFKAEPNQKKTRTGVRKERNPQLADLRVFKSGAVYPSQQLVADFNLEYRSKEDTTQGNGFDVINSKEYYNTKNFNPAFLMIAPVDKKAGKVDLFNACTYDENGNPNTTVMEQGATSFGKELLRMIKDVYGLEPNTDGYIDLNVETVDSVNDGLREATNGIYNLPKPITRGPHAGITSYVRRENLDIYVLAPATLVEDSSTIEDEETNNDGNLMETAIASVN